MLTYSIRCIAASPTLLAAALESESLEEFLNDTNGVTATDLRNLVVSLEGASNEAIRDACADYWNADLIADVFERDIDHPDEISISSDESSDYSSDDTFYNKSPSKRNKQVMTVGSQTAVLKVGGRRTKGRYERRSPKIAPSPEKKKKKRDATTIELFGYTIYKSRIETRVGRQGWYQFAAMTGCSVCTRSGACNVVPNEDVLIIHNLEFGSYKTLPKLERILRALYSLSNGIFPWSCAAMGRHAGLYNVRPLS